MQAKKEYNISKRLGDEMEYQIENFNGEYDFRSRLHDGWQVPLHLHEYSEWLYCRSGSGTVSVNGREIHLKAGEMVFIPPNYVHGYDFPTAEVICAVFSNDFIPLFFRTLGDRYFLVSAINASGVSEILERFPHLREGETLVASGYLSLIAAAVLAQSSFEAARPTDGILYQKVISYISAHFAEPLTLSSVAKVFGYNEKYLSHALHSLTGIHFCRLLNHYRINRAKELLITEKGLSIGEISSACGFLAQNTFNREFKESAGMSPSEYRRRNAPVK
jgi:AraC-like DNA-binding protein